MYRRRETVRDTRLACPFSATWSGASVTFTGTIAHPTGGALEDHMDATATATGGPQHLRALERANEVRLARAELKRRIADGQLPAADVILSSPWEAESMAVADVLMSQRRWGRTRARRFLAGIQMSETKTLGSMTERQRHAVALAIRETRSDVAVEAREPALSRA